MNDVDIDDFTSTFDQLRNQIEKLITVNIKYKKTINKLRSEVSTIKKDTNENYTIIKNITPTDFNNIIDTCVDTINQLQKTNQENLLQKK